MDAAPIYLPGGLAVLGRKANDVKKRDIFKVDPNDVLRMVREKARKQSETRSQLPVSEDDEPDSNESWWTKLHHVLTQDLAADTFERLVMRMLRESGFVQVEVTGRSGDGGIDGKGIMRIGGLLCFHVFFQCKKHKDTVGPAATRDFGERLSEEPTRDCLLQQEASRVRQCVKPFVTEPRQSTSLMAIYLRIS